MAFPPRQGRQTPWKTLNLTFSFSSKGHIWKRVWDASPAGVRFSVFYLMPGYQPNRGSMSLFNKKVASAEVAEKKPVEIRETKCTCKACSNVWFYGKEDVAKNKAAKMNQVGKAMMCCGGCFPALLIPNQKVIDLDKCPKCGSKAVEKEVVTHHV